MVDLSLPEEGGIVVMGLDELDRLSSRPTAQPDTRPLSESENSTPASPSTPAPSVDVNEVVNYEQQLDSAPPSRPAPPVKGVLSGVEKLDITIGHSVDLALTHNKGGIDVDKARNFSLKTMRGDIVVGRWREKEASTEYDFVFNGDLSLRAGGELRIKANIDVKGDADFFAGGEAIRIERRGLVKKRRNVAGTEKLERVIDNDPDKHEEMYESTVHDLSKITIAGNADFRSTGDMRVAGSTIDVGRRAHLDIEGDTYIFHVKDLEESLNLKETTVISQHAGEGKAWYYIAEEERYVLEDYVKTAGEKFGDIVYDTLNKKLGGRCRPGC